MPAKGLACRKGRPLIMRWRVRSLSVSPQAAQIHCEVFLPATPTPAPGRHIPSSLEGLQEVSRRLRGSRVTHTPSVPRPDPLPPFQPSAQHMQSLATQRKGSSMTSLVMTRARRPGMAMGMGTSTAASRLTSPRKTSSTCSLAVASHLVSPPPPSLQPGLTRWWRETGCQPLPLPAAPS